VSFELYQSEILGVVGESGSGKSTFMRSLYFDVPVTSGQAFLKAYNNGETDIFNVSSQQQRAIRNNLLGMVYQNPLMGLLMDFSNGGNIAQKLIAAGNRNVFAMQSRTAELLGHMEIPISRVKEPPKNFSGGMQQRVQISKALANNPPILLLDEVTTGLDLSVQAKVLDLIRMVQKKFNIAIVVVSHDLAVIRMLADRTIVMLDGEIVEHGFTDQILEDPQHRFTQTLVHSLI
jgi:putative phosphonate transport system ATP-binding protein